MEWIKVKDRLPEFNEEVLAYTPDGAIWMADYDPEDDGWKTTDNYQLLEDVTHWMPLPDPPAK